jgi:hypothetical protein
MVYVNTDTEIDIVSGKGSSFHKKWLKSMTYDNFIKDMSTTIGVTLKAIINKKDSTNVLLSDIYEPDFMKDISMLDEVEMIQA